MTGCLAGKIENRSAKIAIIGLGYVGLPLATAFAKAGFEVSGVDIDVRKLQEIRNSKTAITGVEAVCLQNLFAKKKLSVTDDFSCLHKMDVLVICVPTPLSKSLDPDMSYILNAAAQIEKYLRPGQLIILESTTYPGTTEELLLPEFEKKGLKAGKDFFLCFSPERIDPGNQKFALKDIPKIVGGVGKESARLGMLLYSQIVPRVFQVSSPRVAEMAKLLENTFRIVNIGLVNELTTVAREMDIDMWEVIEAAATKPFGFMPFYPGPGIGGHCIGVDPMYLSWKAKFHGREIKFIEIARQINAEMPNYIARKVSEILNQQGLAVRGSNILLLGLAYKKDVEDTRESPAFAIIESLLKQGAKISYHDPFVREVDICATRLHSLDIAPERIRKFDLVLITTDHTRVDYEIFVQHAKRIFDTRNVLKKFTDRDNIIRL
ncbi:MAG: nucleotide sugar dehydrogenase [Candidatus Omnitrophica bacterium]|nr:nucleotide sugar dehydrogenase [Candidatus Omnitrophota bacterium]